MTEENEDKSTFEVTFQGHMQFFQAVKDETEIGKVLITASYLDEQLKKIISDFLIKSADTKDLLSGANAPLGTFSARTKMALALGLITKREAKSLDAVRNIRNAFAHNISARLSDPKIWKMLNPLGWFLREDLTDVSKNDPVEVFFIASHRLALLLFNRPDHVRSQRLVARDWSPRRIDYDPDFDED